MAICGLGVSPESVGGRAGLLDQVFGGYYPEAAWRPRPKATFAEVFWRRHTRLLVAAWDGAGVDPSVVAPTQLRWEWDRPHPDLCTAMLAQQVWLTSTLGGPS